MLIPWVIACYLYPSGSVVLDVSVVNTKMWALVLRELQGAGMQISGLWEKLWRCADTLIEHPREGAQVLDEGIAVSGQIMSYELTLRFFVCCVFDVCCHSQPKQKSDANSVAAPASATVTNTKRRPREMDFTLLCCGAATTTVVGVMSL